MQFTTLTLAALSVTGSLAQDMVKTHVVRVGSLSGDLTFSPSQVDAAVGEMVQFQFAPKNHTVTQSTFDKPCEPSILNSNVTGIYSGFIPVAADAVTTATYTIKIADAKPLWLYCSQGKHCQSGMVMVINPPAANKSRTLETYKALAKDAPVNLPGDVVSGGSPGNSTGGGSGSDSGSGSGSGSGSATPSADSGSTPTTSSGAPVNTGAASTLRTSEAMTFAGLVALGMAFFL